MELFVIRWKEKIQAMWCRNIQYYAIREKIYLRADEWKSVDEGQKEFIKKQMSGIFLILAECLRNNKSLRRISVWNNDIMHAYMGLYKVRGYSGSAKWCEEKDKHLTSSSCVVTILNVQQETNKVTG